MIALLLVSVLFTDPPRDAEGGKGIVPLITKRPEVEKILGAPNDACQSSQSKRELDNRVPDHLPIKVKIKKEREESFQDLTNERWIRDFELEVKNTGDRPIYALSVAWVLEEVTMPDGNHYGSTFLYGRGEFITNPGERPKPEDVPIQPGETHVFKLSKSRVEGWEGWARDNHLPQPKSVLVFFDWLSFGDGTGWHSPGGKRFERRTPLALLLSE